MTDPAYLTKLHNAISAVKAEHVRLGERLLDLEKLATHEPTAGQQMKRLIDSWFTRWGAQYRERYVPTEKDRGNFKRLLKDLTADEIDARMVRYLADQDPFLAMQKHPLNIFFSQINRFGQAATIEPRPVGCSHDPACTSEAAHTRLMQQARRRVQ